MAFIPITAGILQQSPHYRSFYCGNRGITAIPIPMSNFSLDACWNVVRWFYGDITADHARQILMQAGKSGSFLVRNRQSVEHQFALSILLDSDVLHVIIVYEASQFTDLCLIAFTQLIPL